MIEVRNLNKSYKTRFGHKHVLSDVSFDLARGERLGVLGRNGAGKSTLIRLVGGAEKPTSGSVKSSMSISWPLAFGGAFQPQLTGVDNVRFISRIYKQDFEHNLAYVERFSELGSYLREPVRTYSSGMMARLAFAISMIIEFDCFLIDEIAAVGDARFHERCNYELFDKRGDRAMMIISHDPGYLRDHCNRWAVLESGRLMQFDDFEAALEQFLVQMRVEEVEKVVAQPFSRRLAAIDSLRRVAHADEEFMARVRQADAARDRHDWKTAEAGYAAALSLHPYERSYWAQLGHVTREQGLKVRAEIAYRTACALGESSKAMEPFMAVMDRSGDGATAYPVAMADSGETRLQPPGYPDLAMLAALTRGTACLDDDEALELLRNPSAMEAVLSRMLGEAQRDRLAVVLPEAIEVVPGGGSVRRGWYEDLARLTGAEQERLETALGTGQDPLTALQAAGGLAGWSVAELKAVEGAQA